MQQTFTAHFEVRFVLKTEFNRSKDDKDELMTSDQLDSFMRTISDFE